MTEIITRGNVYHLNDTQVLKPLPYEKAGHSQHFEDGIIEVMTDAIIDPNQTFLEIGFGEGTQNMTLSLIKKGWKGVGIDGFEYEALNPEAKSKLLKYKKMFVEPKNLNEAFADTPKDVDFFSLDIDSFDFEVCRWLLRNEYRPKTVCLEFNPRFGPIIEASFPYEERVKKKPYRKKGTYGSSIAKYKKLWEHYGYRYFTYDTSLTNLFFYHPETVKDLSHLPVHTLEEFPIKQDDNKKIIIHFGYWVGRLDEIYKDFTP